MNYRIELERSSGFALADGLTGGCLRSGIQATKQPRTSGK